MAAVSDVRGLLADVAGVGPFFAIDTSARPPGTGWVPLGALDDPHGPLGDRIGAVGAALDTPSVRVAASIAFQGIAAQVVAPLFAAATLHRALPDASRPGETADRVAALSSTLHWRPRGAGPWLWWPGEEGSVVPCPEPSGLATVLVGLLAPVVRGVRARVPVAERVLWGNAASAVASARQLVAAARPDDAAAAADVARQVLTTPPLAATASLGAPEPPDAGWSFRRRSCCLYHRVPGGGVCGDCVLRRGPGQR